MLYCHGSRETEKERLARRLKYTQQKLANKINALKLLINDCGQSEDVKRKLRNQVVDSFK